MKLSEFDYNLPKELIAQTPLKTRSNSRLMVLNRHDSTIKHQKFSDVISLFKKGDCLVLNDTKVLPSRIFGKKTDTGANIEVLLLKELLQDEWEILVRPARRVNIGTKINFGDLFLGEITRKFNDGLARVKFAYDGIFLDKLYTLGQMPLPPYIHEELTDQDRYQTIYAKNLGSAAAPTAGLHFTKEVLSELENKGVTIVYITLHVGLATFRNVTTENITEHKMHDESYVISEEVATTLNQAKAEKNRIISVGTTTARALEANFNKHNKFTSENDSTDIFIYPGYNLVAIDALLTNFHLPKSTLLMLVSAFANREFILKAYEEAIAAQYRFFSFGDAMLIM